MHSSLVCENDIISPVAPFASKIGTTNQCINFLQRCQGIYTKDFSNPSVIAIRLNEGFLPDHIHFLADFPTFAG